jgi:hypothetical protein
MLKIYNIRFQMEMGCGIDTWRITGECPEHPKAKAESGYLIFPSSPKEYDPETNIMKTYSGRVYEIVSYENKEKFVTEIQECLSYGGFRQQ